MDARMQVYTLTATQMTSALSKGEYRRVHESTRARDKRESYLHTNVACTQRTRAHTLSPM
jgi:hypothetical protein